MKKGEWSGKISRGGGTRETDAHEAHPRDRGCDGVGGCHADEVDQGEDTRRQCAHDQIAHPPVERE